MKTSPRAGDTDFPPLPAHAGGEVLEVTYGVTKKAIAAIGSGFQNPLQSFVGPRPFKKYLSVLPQIS